MCSKKDKVQTRCSNKIFLAIGEVLIEIFAYRTLKRSDLKDEFVWIKCFDWRSKQEQTTRAKYWLSPTVCQCNVLTNLLWIM